MSKIVDVWGRPYNVEHHRIMSEIFYHHTEANPVPHSEEYLAEQREARDRLMAYQCDSNEKVRHTI